MASQKGVQVISFPNRSFGPRRYLRVNRSSLPPPFLELLSKRLEDYFKGKSVSFQKIPVDLSPFPLFTKKVLMACAKIPFGKTISYKNLARRLNHPRAMRAVGNALGNNRVPILIPCHRVIREDGNLGGYTAGEKWKRILLGLEKRSRQNTKGFIDNAQKRVLYTPRGQKL